MGRGRSRSSVEGSSGGASIGGYGMGHGHMRMRHHHRRGGVYVSTGPSILGYILFIILGLAFVGVGIWLLCGAYAWAPTSGTCVLNEQTGKWYYSTYEYVVDGQDYRERSDEGWEFPEEIDEVVTIYYLKSNPEKITENAPQTGAGWAFAAFGAVFAGLGVAITIQQSKRKNRTELDDKSEPSIQETPKPQKRKCSYCGATYSQDKKNCPKCGASQ